MIDLTPWIWGAGAVQMVIAAANIFIPKKLSYAENLAKVTPIVRQVFIIHSVYIVWVLVVFALICLLYAAELASGTGLGRFMSAWMALFWGARVFIQRFYYDAAAKRLNRAADIGFTLAFAYLAIVFTLAAIGGRPVWI
jgi:hypothetical protein